LKGDFLYNFLFPTRIAGGFLFRFAQLPKGINKNPSPARSAEPGFLRDEIP